jgi:hypothetical protein
MSRVSTHDSFHRLNASRQNISEKTSTSLSESSPHGAARERLVISGVNSSSHELTRLARKHAARSERPLGESGRYGKSAIALKPEDEGEAQPFGVVERSLNPFRSRAAIHIIRGSSRILRPFLRGIVIFGYHRLNRVAHPSMRWFVSFQHLRFRSSLPSRSFRARHYNGSLILRVVFDRGRRHVYQSVVLLI